MKAKFNIIDALIILLIIAVGAAGYLFLNGRSEVVSNDKNVKIRYNIELSEKGEYMTDLFKEGDRVTVGEKEKLPAVIVGAEVKPAVQSSFDEVNGRYINAEIPEKYDIVLTLESDATDSAGQVSVAGSAVRVGSSTMVKGRNFAGNGYITDLKIEE